MPLKWAYRCFDDYRYYYLYSELLASAPSGSSISGCNEVKPRPMELYIKSVCLHNETPHTHAHTRTRLHWYLRCAKRKFKDINKTSRRLMKSREPRTFLSGANNPLSVCSLLYSLLSLLWWAWKLWLIYWILGCWFRSMKISSRAQHSIRSQ